MCIAAYLVALLTEMDLFGIEQQTERPSKCSGWWSEVFKKMAYLSLVVSLMRKRKWTEESNLWRERNSWFLYQFSLLMNSTRAVTRTESSKEPAHSSTKAVPRVSLCTEDLKIAMFVSWPSVDLSSLDINTCADLIPVNGGHEVNWNGIHLRSLLRMRLGGWLSRCQVRIWKHGFSQDLFLPRNISQNFPGTRNSLNFSLILKRKLWTCPSMRYGQIFHKMSCNRGFLINFFVLNAEGELR